MGLDMYALVAPKNNIPAEVNFDLNDVGDLREIHYWRKHPNLHGWMHNLYLAKGGTEQFNCVPVVLTEADIDDLEQAIRNGELPQTSGFFFGESDGSEQSEDLAFIKEARELMAEGYAVIYDSWW
jgi:hypothetical protein